jgi:hypothetical protein
VYGARTSLTRSAQPRSEVIIVSLRAHRRAIFPVSWNASEVRAVVAMNRLIVNMHEKRQTQDYSPIRKRDEHPRQKHKRPWLEIRGVKACLSCHGIFQCFRAGRIDLRGTSAIRRKQIVPFVIPRAPILAIARLAAGFVEGRGTKTRACLGTH